MKKARSNDAQDPTKQDALALALSLRELAQSGYEDDEFDGAYACAHEAIRIAEQLGVPEILADFIEFAAAVAVKLEDPEQAIQLANDARARWLEPW